MTADRIRFSSGSPFESVVGYSRAIRVGPFISVSGTTASAPDGPVGGDDMHQQTAEVLNRVEAALTEAGGGLSDVVRTRIYLTDIDRFADVAKAHAAVFGEIRPATTVVEVSALATPALLVEIEADAILADQL